MKKLFSRRGASLTSALLLFLICAAVSLIMVTNAVVSASHSASVRGVERQYASASSAARIIRDSMTFEDMTDFANINILTMMCLQSADNEDYDLTVIIEADGMPPAVCIVAFDNEYNLTATVEAGTFLLRLTIPADVPGVVGWSKENALIERIERQE